MSRSSEATRSGDRGASAVEFGLVFPVMALVILATVEFGKLLTSQIILTQAAREGVREAALGRNLAAVQARVDLATDPLTDAAAAVADPCPADPGPQDTVQVTVTYELGFFIAPDGLTLTSKAVMQCLG